MACNWCGASGEASECEECTPLAAAGDAGALALRALDNFERLQEAIGLDGPELLDRLRRMLGQVDGAS